MIKELQKILEWYNEKDCLDQEGVIKTKKVSQKDIIK